MERKENTTGRIFFAIAFLIGCIAVGWMCSVFIFTNALALTVTLTIGCVYGVGAAELLQFRKATATLIQAILKTKEKVAVLEDWLKPVDTSLHNSVRKRIQGDRVGLPAPMLTPYFVGLLVMLGLLGTFVGMVHTLRGAVIALEGTTELEAIRAALAAPINGLGMAFGTSVAGVTTSAMLGLMSTLSKRDRMLATRNLDSRIATIFQDFSLAHSQQKTFEALQIQTRALPEVTQMLSAMADKLEKVGDSLIKNQDQFHASVERTFSDLAVSMDKTHKESLAENIRLTGESIKPIVADVMRTVAAETGNIHEKLSQTSKENLTALSGQLAETTAQVTRSVTSALADQHHANDHLIQQMQTTLHDFKHQFEHMAESFNDSFNTITAAIIEHQKEDDDIRLTRWTSALENIQTQTTRHLSDTSNAFSSELRQVVAMQQETFETAQKDLVSLSDDMTSQWQQAGQETLNHQAEIAGDIKNTLRAISSDMHMTSEQLQKEFTRLLTSSEELVKTRINNETVWLDAHRGKMEALTHVVKSELLALRNDEEHRGQAALERLAVLESVVAEHLTTMGKALEAPMTRLIQTAEQAPRAAADVISILRREASDKAERDTLQLKEQERILKEIETLSCNLTKTSTDQQAAIEQLVRQSKGMLEDVACQFNTHMSAEAVKFSGVAETFAGSAFEMASLGDAFGTAVTLFSKSNEQLMENLSKIEHSLETATTRSDDQLAYYVAQAREIIDHCMLSQKEIFDDLQKLRQNDAITMAG